MFVMLLMVIGFFMVGGTLGANLIGAFDIVIYLWWFVVILAGIISVVVILGSAVLGAEAFSNVKGGSLVGSVFGMILSAVIMAYSTAMLWLSYYIVDHIVPTVDNWEGLSSDARNAIIAYGILLFVSIFKSKFVNTK